MVITLAMISVFTLAAGAAVATLMPARLALWNIPRVAARPPAAASQVLPGARSSAPLPTSRGLSAALSGILGSRVLGKQAGAEVVDPGDRAGAVRPGGLDPDPARPPRPSW